MVSQGLKYLQWWCFILEQHLTSQCWELSCEVVKAPCWKGGMFA